jgi:hypothetical protein
MSEDNFGKKIRFALNDSLELEPRIADRLELARTLATEAHATRWVTTVTHSGSSREATFSLLHDLTLPRLLLPIIVLIVGLMTIQSLKQVQTAEEIEEIDTAVLTGDLPLDAYMDAGFDAWLRRSSR